MRTMLWFRSPLRQGGLPIAGNALLHPLCRPVPEGLPRCRTCSFAKSPECFSFRCCMSSTELLLPRDNTLARVESDPCAQYRVVRCDDIAKGYNLNASIQSGLNDRIRL